MDFQALAISLLAMSQQEKRFLPARAIALGGAVLYLWANLFASPRVPFLIGGDQAYFWMRAMWMLDGKSIYRDFLQFSQPPGLDFVFAALFRIFGLQMWVANAVVLVLGVAFVWLVFSIARRFMRTGAAALAAAVFLVPIYGKALNATHHWFAVLAVLAAIRVVLGGVSARRLVVAGVLLGVGSYFSLYHGLAGLLAFSVFLLWSWSRSRTTLRWASVLRDEALLFGAYVAAMALLYCHYLADGGTVGELWYFQVTCVRRFIVSAYRGAGLFFPLPLTLHNLPALGDYFAVYMLLSVAMVGGLILCWKRRGQYESIAPAVLVMLVAVFLFAEVGVSAWWLRIYAVSAPAVILLTWVIDQLPRMRVCVSIVLWVWIAVLSAHQTMAHHRMQRAVVDLPAGRVATTAVMAARLTSIAQFLQPGDAVFQAAWPGVYLPLHVRNPMAFETANVSDMPRPGDVELATRQLEERRTPYVLWAARLDGTCLSPCSDRLSPMRDYVHATYEQVATLPDGDTLWRRRR